MSRIYQSISASSLLIYHMSTIYSSVSSLLIYLISIINTFIYIFYNRRYSVLLPYFNSQLTPSLTANSQLVELYLKLDNKFNWILLYED